LCCIKSACLSLLLIGTKTHCWARNGLADGLGIGGLVLPAFDIGL
jgi:hypothetical protein